MDADQRCRTCRWWQPPNSEPDVTWPESVLYGACRLTVIDDAETVNMITLAAADHTEVPGETCYAWIICQAEFGCVQWQAREVR